MRSQPATGPHPDPPHDPCTRKLASLAEDGAQARELIQGGDVTVNGEVETRRGHHLSPGELVEVDAPWGRAAAIVGTAS